MATRPKRFFSVDYLFRLKVDTVKFHHDVEQVNSCNKAMQSSFSALKYAAKEEMTRRDLFRTESQVVTPQAELGAALKPHYPKGAGRGRPRIGLEHMQGRYIV